MDAVNERKVWEQVVKSSSGADVPQYFVITPKVLT